MTAKQELDQIKENIKTEMIRLIMEGKYVRAVRLYRVITKAPLDVAAEYAKTLRQEILVGKHGAYIPQLVDPHYKNLREMRL